MLAHNSVDGKGLYFIADRPSIWSRSVKNHLYSDEFKKAKTGGRDNIRFSSIHYRFTRCKNNPIHPTQPGLVLRYYWGNYLHFKKNQGPVKVFSNTSPIGKNIRKHKRREHCRKSQAPSGVGIRYTYKYTHKFEHLISRLDTRWGMKLNLSHGPSWIADLGKKYPIIGG